MTVIPWGRPEPLKGYRLEAGPAEAREQTARGVLLDLVRLHAAGDVGALWRALDEVLPSGRRRVVEICASFLELHQGLAEVGQDTLFLCKQAAGFLFWRPEVDDELSRFRRERDLVPFREWDDPVTGRAMAGCFWPEGPRHMARVVLAFERDRDLDLWRDCSSRVAADLKAERERIEATRKRWTVQEDEPPKPAFPATADELAVPEPVFAAPALPASSEADPPPATTNPTGGTDEDVDGGERDERARSEGQDRPVDLVPAAEAVAGETVRLQALELRRRQLAIRAKAAVDELLVRLVAEKRWPRTLWDEAITGDGWSKQTFRGVGMCMHCGKPCAGQPVLYRFAEREKVALVIHEPCVEPGYLAQKGPYGALRDMGAWLQDRGIPLPLWTGFALAELLVVTYRRIYDLEALDWSSRPQKTCRSPRPCAICGEQLAKGARYVDGGGPEKSAHVACAGVEEEWKKRADERAQEGAA